MHVAQSICATATDPLKKIQPLNQIANCPAIAAETDRINADFRRHAMDLGAD